MDELAAYFAGRAKIAKINVRTNLNLARKYGVESIPTFLLFNNGRVIDQAVGARAKGVFAEKIERAIGR